MKALILFLLLIVPLAVFAQLIGKVVKVYDGDSFTLLTDNNRRVRVRLHGIDCPALNQPFGKAARDRAAALIAGKILQVDSTDRDRYGRVIAIVPLNPPEGDFFARTLNEALLADGLAWHYKKYDRNSEWAKLEDAARRNKIGLWQLPNPIAPWEWRKQKK